MLSGNGLFLPESVTLQAFLPKGELAADTSDGECDRDANAVQFLGIRNASIQLLSAAVNLPSEDLWTVSPLGTNAAS
eukprot:4972471-Pyramimonas_sp.AAC.1